MLLFPTYNAFSQTPNLPKDTTRSSPLIKTDTLVKKSNDADGLTSTVTYKAGNELIEMEDGYVLYLIEKARVMYTDFQEDADYIRLDQAKGELFSRGGIDTATKKYSGRPIFKLPNEPASAVDSLLYNYKTKRAKAFGASSEVEQGFITAQQIKKNEYNEASLWMAVYSTCDLPYDQKHYGIYSRKILLTKNQIVTGPAYLKIEGVPLPIGIPFGFFPKTNKRASGILFPTFGEDFTRGFFMRDLGYYIGLNDYWDAALRGTLYSKGSYETNLIGSYRKNYKFSGNVNLRYASTKTGLEGTPTYKPQKDFNIQWSHSQAAEANPGTTFSANVNIGTSSYFSRTAAGGTYDISQLTRNNLSSSIAYGRNFGLFNFTSSLSHRQDLTTKNIYLELPSFNLGMNTINPFDSKDRVGEQKWYQRISLGYSLQGNNSIDTREDLLFQPGGFKKFRTAFQHAIPIGLSLNVFKYFQFSNSVNYNEKWYLQTIRKSYNAPLNLVQKDTVRGFERGYEYTLSTGLSTKVYGLKQFKKGKFQAIRHVMTPSMNFSYRPDFGSDKYGYYRNVQTDAAGNIQRYSIFEDGGGPSPGRSASIGFSLDNTIEAKLRSKEGDTSSTPRKVSILQGLSFSGNYNFVADSFKLSAINFNGRTVLFKESVGVNFYGTFDPYKIDNLGRRINTISFTEGKLPRLTNAGLSFDFSLNSNAAKKRNEAINEANKVPARTPAQEEALARVSRDPNAFVDFNVPWNVSASYSFNYSRSFNSTRAKLESVITNTLNFYGDLTVTPKWKVQYTSGYDFQLQKMSITNLSFYRDLHCWDMAFTWVPFGTYRSYSVNIKVKASILQDLKLSRRRDNFNNF